MNKKTTYIKRNDGKTLKIEVEVKPVYHIIVISDTRYPAWYGGALATNGMYVNGTPAKSVVNPVRFKSLKAALIEAKRQIQASRQVALGGGHGLMHTVMTFDRWVTWQESRRKKA